MAVPEPALADWYRNSLQSAADVRGERRRRVISPLAWPSLTTFGERPLTIDSERLPYHAA